MAVRSVNEWRDASGSRFRFHGNEPWLLDQDGCMAERHANIDDRPIAGPKRLPR